MATIDAVTVEVLQNRLTQIGHESGVILTKTAASPVVIDAKDVGFNIADHLGRSVVYSVWMPRHGTTLSYMLKSCVARYGMENIFPGDVFLVNNPHDGALHISDIAVIAPIHYEGELLAWSGCATHHLDIGGMTAGWSPGASDWFQEGIKFSPIKLVERGELREDLFNLFLDNVRARDFQGHDLMAQLAAIRFADRNVKELALGYGVETLKSAYDEIIHHTELKTRERIRSLIAGRYEYTDYIEYADDVHELKCSLEVTEDRLTFDFDGTNPESKHFINAALPCTVANVHNIVTCMLLPDIPANEGCFNLVDVRCPEGTVLSCLPPAPCSGASILGGWKAQTMATGVLAQALRRSTEERRATAVWGDAHAATQVSGTNQAGKWFTLFMMEGSMQGGGARQSKDGVDMSNIAGSTNTSLANVESIEQRYPVLYIKRGFAENSEGAGKWRGGLGGENVVTPHDTSGAQILPFYIDQRIPARGFEGGCPSGTTFMGLCRGATIDSNLHTKVDEWISNQGFHTLPTKGDLLDCEPGDLLYLRCKGGGGYGDPLEREASRVRGDVREGYVSTERASAVYGVIFDEEGRVDEWRTQERRESLRNERIAQAVPIDSTAIEYNLTCTLCGDEAPVATVRSPNTAQAGSLQYTNTICHQCGRSLDLRYTLPAVR